MVSGSNAAGETSVSNAIGRMMSSLIPGVIADGLSPDVPIIACNQAFLDLTGYQRNEVVGRNCRFLSRGKPGPRARRAFRRCLQEKKPAMIEVVNFRKDGSPFLNGVTISPIATRRGKVVAYLGSQVILEDAKVAHTRMAQGEAIEALDQLTLRQRQAVIYLAAGIPIKQIAHELGICDRAVKMHRAKAMQSLGVDHPAEAIRIAVKAGY